ncbi:MAG TPA: FKBP-type peptidyl-prolyl cis-trans isomerase [Saprospiraceae bacterium]|nr:FKBP-type peptidyl-prolyl cis-trans isomerase [Saprospiraceae bacterium]HPI07506.1 FKBP-type peptidyl-prolyl cis-trans isomerase [Saprospiraceae bacterium]
MRKLFFLALIATVATQIACKKGSVTTEHGYKFTNHTEKGGTKPQPGETVLLQTYTYIGDSLMASTQKNYGGPREFALFEKDKLPKRVPAIYDACLLMGEGDSATVVEVIDTFLQKFIPPALKDAKEVRYEIVLVDIITKEEKQKAEDAAKAQFSTVEASIKEMIGSYNAGSLNDKLTTTASGLKVYIVEKGSGAPLKTGESIKTNYYGALKDGTMFDNSYERGEPLTFPVGLGQMIPGYDEGAMLLNHGGKAYFFIPPALGYGPQANGPIPANSELIFYVEIL